MGVTVRRARDDRSHRQPSLATLELSFDLMHPLQLLSEHKWALSRAPLLVLADRRGGFLGSENSPVRTAGGLNWNWSCFRLL